MKFIYGIIISLILSFCTINISFAAGDLLEGAFQGAKSDDSVVDIGNNATAVGNWIFNGGKTLTTNGLENRDPVLVKIAKLLLKITIAIGVTMFLIGGIMYLLSLGDQSAMRKAMKNLFISGAGVILALFSMAIIDLITSIMSSVKL